jgi:hypothetical protein
MDEAYSIRFSKNSKSGKQQGHQTSRSGVKVFTQQSTLNMFQQPPKEWQDDLHNDEVGK